MRRVYILGMDSAGSLHTAYAWQDGVNWYYADAAESAPENAVEVDCIAVGNDVVLKHEVGGTFEAIWGGSKTPPEVGRNYFQDGTPQDHAEPSRCGTATFFFWCATQTGRNGNFLQGFAVLIFGYAP
jgi:hypothetical protein